MSTTKPSPSAGVFRRLAAALSRPVQALTGRRRAGHGAELQHLIESQIVPRLVIADGLAGNGGAEHPHAAWEPTTDDVEEFARLLVEHDAGVAVAYVGVLTSKGARAESLWLGLLAPAARHLNQLSSDGTVDATDVMRAQERLREVIATLEQPLHSTFSSSAFAGPGGRG